MLSLYGRRLWAVLVPRVSARWPAIAAIALAVVLAHSGAGHLDPLPAVAEHYRTALGTDAAVRWIGVLQLFAAGGLVFDRTRCMTLAALAAVLLLAIANQVRMDRGGIALLPSFLLLGWTALIGWGEARRPAALRRDPSATS